MSQQKTELDLVMMRLRVRGSLGSVTQMDTGVSFISKTVNV